MTKDEDLKDQTDEVLMKAYQEGSERAFEVLYQRHSPKVYGYLYGKLKDRAFADDVFQAAFAKLHQSRKHYDPSFPFVPWLFTVCRSVMLDGLRKRKRTLEDLDSISVENAEAPSLQIETIPALPSLEGLSVEQRKVVELRFGENLSFDDIAIRLETSPANARQMVSRAVRKLRKLMDKTGSKS